MERQLLARITYGSHLFGLATPESDRDFVSIVLPSSDDILLGTADFTTFVGSTSDDFRRNTKADVDEKQISLARFVRYAESGTLEAIELLNAPDEFHTSEPHPVFRTLQANRDRLASKDIEKIIGFCKAQALTYAPRKERLVAAQAAVEFLRSRGVDEKAKTRAGVFFDGIVEHCASEFVSVAAIPNILGRDILHIDICGRKVAETVAASLALEVAESVVKRYGRRVRDVASMSANDWKSLSHAIRIAHEGAEYVETGMLTFPVRDAERLRAIKQGIVPMDEIAVEIDGAISELERRALESRLPETADAEFVKEMLREAHLQVIASRFDPGLSATFRS